MESKDSVSQRVEELIHLKFFAHKVGIIGGITNSARIISFTSKSFIARDYSGKVKESVDFSEIDAILPSINAVSSEFNIKEILPNSAATKEFEVIIRLKKRDVIKPKKEHFLSVLHYLRDDYLKLDKEMFNLQRINPDGSFTEVMLLISHSSLEVRSDTFATITSKFLPTLVSFHKNKARSLDFALVFGLPEVFFKTIRFAAPDEATVSQIVTKLERNVDKVYARRVDVKFVDSSEFAQVRSCVPREWSFFFSETIFKFSKNKVQPSELMFGLTSEYIVLWEKQLPNTINKVKELTNVVSLTLSQDYLDRLTIHFKDLSQLSMSCGHRYVFVANIVEVAKLAGNSFIEVTYNELPPDIRVGPYERDSDIRFDEYFVEKLTNMQGNPNSSNKHIFTQNLRECNVNILEESMALRDKERKLLSLCTDWYNAVGLDKDYYTELITEILNLVNRTTLSSAKTTFDDIAHSSKIRNIVSSVLKADSPRLREVGSVLLSTILSRTVITKEYKGTVISDLCVQDIIPILSDVAKNFDEADDRIYLAYLYAEILVVYCLLPQNQDKTLLGILTKNFALFFDLSRIPCFALNQKAAKLMQYILDQNVKEPAVHKYLQEQCRDQCALIWQVYLAVSTGSRISAQVVASMSHTNPQSMDLVTRIFPAGFVKKYTRVAAPPLPTGKKDPKKKPKLPQGPPPKEIDCAGLFEAAQRDYEEPSVVWNKATRSELCTKIQKEIDEYQRLKALTSEKNCVWNWEEFTVHYAVLDSEIRVGQYYVNQILKSIPNAEIAEPQEFISQLLLKLYSRNLSTYTEVVVLKVLAWCFSQYRSKLDTNLLTFENIVALLQSNPEQAVMDQWLTFLNEIFTDATSVREFVKLGGIPIIVTQLTHTHSASDPSLVVSGDLLTPIHPSIRGSVILNLLTRCIMYMSPLNSANQVKLPFSRVKAILSETENIARITQVLATFESSPLHHQLFDLAVGLLENLISFNELVAGELYKTGLFYFLLQHEGDNFEAIARLFKKLHLKQRNNLNTSILYSMLPKALVDLLDVQPPSTASVSESSAYFAQVFCSETYTPILVWNQTMRVHMITHIRKHIGDFVQQLKETEEVFYQFTPIPQITYPMLDAYFKCNQYYVPYLLLAKTWPIDYPERVLVDAVKIVRQFDEDHNYILPSIPDESFFQTPNPEADKLRKSNDRRVPILLVITSLFQRYPHTYNNQQLLPYPIIFKWISENLNTDELPFLGAPDDSLVTTAFELLLTSVTGSKQAPPNLKAFIDSGGVKCAGDALYSFTFWKRKNVLEDRTEKIQTTILEILQKCTVVKNKMPLVMESSVIRDILRFLLLESPRALLVKALALISDLLSIPELRERFYLVGAHFYLIPLMLQPATLQTSQPNAPVFGSDDVRNIALNAAQALALLVGLVDDGGDAEVVVKIQRTVAKLITPGIFHVLDTASTGQDFLFFLQKDHFTPISLWNRNVMTELLQYVLKWLKDNKNSDEVAVTYSCDVRYTDHMKELMIGDVFLSAYNQNPRFTLDYPLFFLQKLFEVMPIFIDVNFSYDSLPDWQERDYAVPERFSAEEVVFFITESIKYAINTHKELESEAALNLQTLLDVLQVSSNFPEEVIRNVFIILTQLSSSAATASHFATEFILYHLATALRARFAGRELVLRIFACLCANSAESIDMIIKTGTILYLFQCILDTHSNAPDRNITRDLSVTTLRQMLFNPERRAQSEQMLLRFLPPYFIKMFLQSTSGPDAVSNKDILNLFDKTQELPELLWNDGTRSELSHAITNQILLLESNSTDIAEWYYDEFVVEYRQIQSELTVGGIFVRIFNQYPSLPLSPTDFLSHLLDAILAESPTEPEFFPVLIEAVYNILSLQPTLLNQLKTDEQIKLQSVISRVLDTLRVRTSWDNVRLLKFLVMTVRLLTTSKTSPLLTFTSDKVITPMVKILEHNSLSDYHVRCLEVVVFLVKSAPLDSVFLAEVAEPDFGLVPCLCELIESTDDAEKSRKAVEVLFALQNNERLKDSIQEQVGNKEKVIDGLNNFESNRAASVYFATTSTKAKNASKFGEPLDLDDPQPVKPTKPAKPRSTFNAPAVATSPSLSPSVDTFSFISPSSPSTAAAPFEFDLASVPTVIPSPNFTTSGLDTIMKPIDDTQSLDSMLRTPTKPVTTSTSTARNGRERSGSATLPSLAGTPSKPQAMQRPTTINMTGFSTSPPKKPVAAPLPTPALAKTPASTLPSGSPSSSTFVPSFSSTPPRTTTSPTPFLPDSTNRNSPDLFSSVSRTSSESIRISNPPAQKVPPVQDDDYLSFLSSPPTAATVASPPISFVHSTSSDDLFSSQVQSSASSSAFSNPKPFTPSSPLKSSSPSTTDLFAPIRQKPVASSPPVKSEVDSIFDFGAVTPKPPPPEAKKDPKKDNSAIDAIFGTLQEVCLTL